MPPFNTGNSIILMSIDNKIKTFRKKVSPMASFQVPYTPAKNQRDKKAQWFFRDEAMHVVCRMSEKPLQLAPQGHFLRGVYETCYDAINKFVFFHPCLLKNTRKAAGQSVFRPLQDM